MQLDTVNRVGSLLSPFIILFRLLSKYSHRFQTNTCFTTLPSHDDNYKQIKWKSPTKETDFRPSNSPELPKKMSFLPWMMFKYIKVPNDWGQLPIYCKGSRWCVNNKIKWICHTDILLCTYIIKVVIVSDDWG